MKLVLTNHAEIVVWVFDTLTIYIPTNKSYKNIVSKYQVLDISKNHLIILYKLISKYINDNLQFQFFKDNLNLPKMLSHLKETSAA